MILLAPQVHFQYDRLKQIFRDTIVMKIPTGVFATYQTGKMLRMVQDAVLPADRIDEEQKKADPRKPFLNSYRILTIGVVNHNGRCRIGYRIYVNGMRDLDGEVLKQSFSLQDLYDVIEYVLSLGEELDAISIAMPGVTYHGRLYHPSIGMWGQFISMDIEERFNHIPTILINDVNAMALGYLDVNSVDLSMITIEALDFVYLGSTIHAVVRPDGYVESAEYHIPLKVSAAGRAVGVRASFAGTGYQTEKWNIHW